MQRDLDLIRRLLQTFEGERSHKAGIVPLIEGYDDETVDYHVHLALDAGLLCHFEEKSRDNYLDAEILTRLSWAGHEWLELVRDETGWRSARHDLLRRTGGSSFALLQVVLEEQAMARVRSPDEPKAAPGAGSTEPGTRSTPPESAVGGRAITACRFATLASADVEASANGTTSPCREGVAGAVG